MKGNSSFVDLFYSNGIFFTAQNCEVRDFFVAKFYSLYALLGTFNTIKAVIVA